MALARDVMVKELITVQPDASVSELVRVLDGSTVTGVPVVDEEESLMGVVSTRDVLRLARELSDVPEAARWGLGMISPPQGGGFFDAPEGEFFSYYVTPSGRFVDARDQIREVSADGFSGYTVRDIMSPVPITIDGGATLQDVARLMRERRVHRVLVVDSDRLVGMITTMDLLGEIAKG